MIATCNLCEGDDKFQVPWDFIGAGLMKSHLREAHGMEPPPSSSLMSDWPDERGRASLGDKREQAG